MFHPPFNHSPLLTRPVSLPPLLSVAVLSGICISVAEEPFPLVAAVVALEYSCLASQHNSEIREPSTVPLNGKISPHRLLYRMHPLLLSFNPLFLACSSYFSSSFRSPPLQSSLSLLLLSISLKPLLTFILPCPSPSFYLFFFSCSLPLVCLF